MFSDRFDQLVQALRILPSVGPKSAQRMALHLIMKNKQGAVGLAHALNEATSYIHECSLCHSLTEDEVCIFAYLANEMKPYFVLLNHRPM